MKNRKNILSKNLEMQKRAKERIPGGTQLLSKRPEMFAPGQWPGYYDKAKGVEVWDLDGNKYVDMSICGIGANILGYADEDVDRAVKAAIDKGSSSSLNCPEEVELADLLCDIHPWAQMVRYARSGGESMSIAVRIARAHTRKEKIAFCGYHGWHDWYLAANLATDKALDGHLLPGLQPNGVPRGLTGTAYPFRYNHIEDLKSIVMGHKNELAAIVIEPVRNEEPKDGFLKEVERMAKAENIILIFDEISSGFRITTGGAHLYYGVTPDMAVFAKAMSNGYPMGAVIGKEAVMQSAQDTFISSTSWTERTGPAAALATIKKFKDNDVAAHLIDIGSRVQQGWQDVAQENNIKIHVSGIAPLSHFSFEYDNAAALMTLFTQEMLTKGFLASGRFYSCFAHQPNHVQAYLKAVGEVFGVIAEALTAGRVEALLKGPICHGGFKRLT